MSATQKLAPNGVLGDYSEVLVLWKRAARDEMSGVVLMCRAGSLSIQRLEASRTVFAADA